MGGNHYLGNPMKPLAVLVVLFLTINSFAQDTSCRNVNLMLKKKWGKAGLALKKGRDAVNWDSAIKQMPLYNQGATGICYAYSAIQLLDHWRQTKGLRITKKIALSSPLYAALLTRQFKESRFYQREDIEGGNIDVALNSIRHFGMCRSDIIQDALNKYADKKAKEYKVDQRELLEMIYLISTEIEDPNRIMRMSDKQITKNYISKMGFYHGRDLNDSGNLPKIFKLVAKSKLKGGGVSNLLDGLFQKCKLPTSIYLGTKKIPNPKEIKLRKGNKKAVQNHIRQLLNKRDAEPLGVGYCSTFLKDKNYRGTKVHENPGYGGQIVTRDTKSCGGHASIIMGKKEIGGKCHYLIRNSWGTKCDKYDWTCRYNAKKEAVGIYVSEDALFRNVTNFHYLGYRDLFCKAKMGNLTDFFYLDYPDMDLSYNQQAIIFNDKIKITFKGMNHQGDDMTELWVSQGKSRSMFNMDRFKRNNLKMENLVEQYSSKKVKDLLVNCIKNQGTRSRLEAKLAKMKTPQKQLICKAKMGNKNQTFQLDLLHPQKNPREDILLFDNKITLLFIMEKKNKKDLTSVLIGSSLSSLYSIDKFPLNNKKMSSFSGKFNYKKIKNFNVRCSKNKNYRVF